MKKQLFFIAMLVIICFSANAQWQYTNLPISSGQVTSFASSGSNLFAGHNDGGVFLSTNSGNSWTAVNSGLTNTIVNALAIDGNNIFAGTNGGVFLSVNNGNSWNNVSAGLTNDSVMSLAISGNNIFAGTCWSGIFRSSDNGNTWTDVNNSLTDTAEILSFLVDGNNIFAGTADGGVFMTTDNGNTWTSTGLTNNTVFSLAKSGNNIYASTWYNGIYLSSDNGNSWSTINNGLTDIRILSLATIGKYIFAGNTFSGDVFLSSDNGNSWSSTGLSSYSSIYTLNIFGNSIFAGIAGNTIWKRPLSEMICLAQFAMVPDTIILHHYYVINNALGTPPLSYLWNWGDGTHDTIAYPSHTYSAAGYYNICLTISDYTGCTNTLKSQTS